MLTRVAPSLFQVTTGERVRIAAVAQKNNGPEAAFFQYGATGLPNVPADQHPGCQFVAAHGMNTFIAQVVFAPGSPTARYDLFEVDAAGNLLDLQLNAQAMFGNSIIQVQIDGQPVASAALAAAARAFVGSAPAAGTRPAPVNLSAATARPAEGARVRKPGNSNRMKKATAPSRRNTKAPAARTSR